MFSRTFFNPLLIRSRMASRSCTLPSPRVIRPLRSRTVTPSTSREAIVSATEIPPFRVVTVIALPGRIDEEKAQTTQTLTRKGVNVRLHRVLKQVLYIWSPVLSFAVARCFTSVNSVPGCSCRKCTSSMNDRMRKMPRPVPRSRFSGASGSGSVSGSRPLP